MKILLLNTGLKHIIQEYINGQKTIKSFKFLAASLLNSSLPSPGSRNYNYKCNDRSFAPKIPPPCILFFYYIALMEKGKQQLNNDYVQIITLRRSTLEQCAVVRKIKMKLTRYFIKFTRKIFIQDFNFYRT